jgi:two-component system chemotaxis response regulator CheY
MDKLAIIYVDDQREVLNTLSKDLQVFENLITLEECESAQEAMDVIDELDAAGDHVAVIVSDHIMPGKNGVEFLTDIKTDGRFPLTKKMLLTGQATHQDTITAINNAGIEKYIEKPWESEDIVIAVKELLTLYVISAGIDYEKYISVLDLPSILSYLKKNG